MKKSISTFAATALSVLLFTACDKNNPETPVPPGGSGNLLLTTIMPNADGMTGAAYMQLLRENESTLSADNSNAIPIPYGGSYPLVIDEDIFVFPSYAGDTKNELVRYSRVNGSLVKKGTMVLPPNNSANSIVKLSSQKAYLSLAGLGMIYVFNPETMQKTGEIDLTSLGVKDKNPDPAIMIERDGFLFIGLSQMVAGWTSPADYTQSDMAVIDTHTDKLVKMISEKNSGFSQPTRPIDPKSIFIDEKGDIYISCLGNFGMVAGHKAGILRIKKGETDFDPTYHWAISGSPITGDPKTAGFISSICYVGNGQAYGYIDMPGYYKPGEQGHTAIANRAVVFDIYKQTLKVIDGLELSNGFGILVSEYKNGLSIANASATKKGIYYIDPASGKVSSTPIIQTVGNPMTLHYFRK